VSLTILINGILIGSLYGLVGMGLSLLAGVVRLINLAQGDVLVGGAYLAIMLHDWLHWDPLLLLPVVAVIIFAVAYVIQRFLLNDILRAGSFAPLVVTFGLSLVLESVYQELFGANSQSLPAAWGDSAVTVLGVRLESAYLVAFAVGAALTAATWFTLRYTRLGRTVRAAAADPSTAALLGVNVERVFAVTFAASAVLAASAGVITAVAQSVTPTGGLSLLLFSFAVMAVAGMGNIAAAFIAGMLLGAFQAVSVAVLGPGTETLAVYVAFFVVLVIRPSGLFVTREARLT
jgi:branched-chain amino acid transport system permease protein